MREFDIEDLKKLYRPAKDSYGEDNGQVTIIGGSRLFYGAPILSLKVSSRIVDMVFFASPEPSVGRVAEQIKSKLMSFIWVPWEDAESYVAKSDAVLIGPGFMRFGSEKNKDHELVNPNKDGQKTREITKHFLQKFAQKRWVIDAGSLQTMDADWIPENAIVTPNKKEYKLLFGNMDPKVVAKKYECIIVMKGPETVVYSPAESVVVKGGNAGLTKGGTGDVLAGLTVALLTKNDPILAACSASFILKAAADKLYKKVGVNYNAEDLVDKIPSVLKSLI
ncbi:MAG: carbohydrate kinase, YjeF related protein [uncultured bacterium]|uniref:ADP-dependent (S)-NAD(P)H-hydrate dehydratase n=1 Tax=Candidatus Woesebacteria bacterium RIFCSPHIGHO2_12_FULL_41_24 TaxID=1802510 RepID=A0A1F8AS43_9BACT|nr:MAG: carbohydrate kinase, YjeF related protein [uncultured bacterium]OGM15109.1 MAG: NAD(P)H-hydrate dehydratase [Candidatus Woesebacteria bacterium RBG_16_41_13]OGM34440.1 MAG: NAD(P)H-hydrate dehydratase [Candidatus Woesebacteria bacterium RIFCSPHIGHO2_02_FULL_42_20]OGM54078.1 MAG: NAD(P)H-hydrate dehydratase [Candidatus Woesebacteria bacterium RIFCSPHIGHO2_12_FULL_41_24]OGM66247.1 MAG: NAD(P)H-hydrate dehydratase [Candidatus Woesebacteria bacterium RIFCSPLOWO2_01_FULL_42_67]OGM72106.1 MA